MSKPLSKARPMVAMKVLVFPDWILPRSMPGRSALVWIESRRSTVCWTHCLSSCE